MSKPKSAKVDIEAGMYFFKPTVIGDIGTQTVAVYGKPGEEEEKKQIIMVVEVVELSKKEKPVTLSKWVTNSGSSQAWGGKLAKALGLKAGWDWTDMLGKVFQAPVTHTEGGNPKIGDPVPIKKGAKYPLGFIKDYKSMFLDENFRKEDFESMPEFIQNAAIKSEEFGALESKMKKGSSNSTATKKGKGK